MISIGKKNMNLINYFKMTARLWWQAWLLIGSVMNWVMTHVILIILFFGILTPIALLARVGGKQFLDTKKDPPRKSYWHYRKITENNKHSYEHQF